MFCSSRSKNQLFRNVAFFKNSIKWTDNKKNYMMFVLLSVFDSVENV